MSKENWKRMTMEEKAHYQKRVPIAHDDAEALCTRVGWEREQRERSSIIPRIPRFTESHRHPTFYACRQRHPDFVIHRSVHQGEVHLRAHWAKNITMESGPIEHEYAVRMKLVADCFEAMLRVG